MLEKAWTLCNDIKEETAVRRTCKLPVGYRGATCDICGSKNLTGAIITQTADEADPDILFDCGYFK
ncbi:hypothetical protein [Methanosarcina siciliae]|uniref:hypothetical protein n=1 Tax=Methanosarcina siciliae TaxID=38027 RepID=UPI000B00AC72|nr:hypothetical protein [Methanosarcina siciliae]